jgi:hypothetical protein
LAPAPMNPTRMDLVAMARHGSTSGAALQAVF